MWIISNDIGKNMKLTKGQHCAAITLTKKSNKNNIYVTYEIPNKNLIVNKFPLEYSSHQSKACPCLLGIDEHLGLVLIISKITNVKPIFSVHINEPKDFYERIYIYAYAYIHVIAFPDVHETARNTQCNRHSRWSLFITRLIQGRH